MIKLLSVLGIARIGRVLWLLSAVAAASAAGGFWAGSEWQTGRAAVTEVADLRADAQALRAAADTLRQSSVSASQDFRTASHRMEQVSRSHRDRLEAIDDLFLQHRDAFDAALQHAVAVDLVLCRIGDYGMRVWAAAASGDLPSPATPATDHPREPARGLPGGAADTDRRQRPSGVEGVDRRGGAVPPLPGTQDRPGDGGGQL